MARIKAKTAKTAGGKVDLAGLDNDAMIALLIELKAEVSRRGIAAEAEVWSAALGDDDAARIAREATAAEVARLRALEARRIASEAAEAVRKAAADEGERARREERSKAEAAAVALNARVRDVAVRARSLFGSDEADFTVAIWSKPGDKRVYIGHGRDNNWVEYYHTGTARNAPGSIATYCGVAKALAAHLGVPFEAAESRIKDFCSDLCEAWETLRVEVNASIAPLDPATVETHYLVMAHPFTDDLFGRWQSASSRWTRSKADADRYPTEARAREAFPRYLESEGVGNISSPDALSVHTYRLRHAFPPKAPKVD